MHGLAAIHAANGWAMAFAGALIVLSGLAVLSLVISQLYRVVNLMERPAANQHVPEEAIGLAELIAPDQDLTDMAAATEAYQPLIDRLTQPFELRELYALAGENSFPHVHLTIKSFREAGKLVSAGDAAFNWQPEGGIQEIPTPPAPAAPAVPAAPAAQPSAAPAAAETPAAPAAKPAPEPAAQAAASGTPVTAPMPGMIVRYEKQVGDSVSEGETVVILEAMKMENALPAPVAGTVKAINFSSGDSVAKEDVLCIID